VSLPPGCDSVTHVFTSTDLQGTQSGNCRCHYHQDVTQSLTHSHQESYGEQNPVTPGVITTRMWTTHSRIDVKRIAYREYCLVVCKLISTVAYYKSTDVSKGCVVFVFLVEGRIHCHDQQKSRTLVLRSSFPWTRSILLTCHKHLLR